MDEIWILLSCILLAILSLILFGKMWGMTNNIRKILSKMNEEDAFRKAQLFYAKGDIDNVEKYLCQAFDNELINLLQNATDKQEWSLYYKAIKEKYEASFKKIGRQSPDFKIYADFNKYKL